MNVLIIGDIFGEPGVRAVETELPKILSNYSIDLVIANAENTTNGKSLSNKDYERLLNAGINVFTMGNHTWSHPDIFALLKQRDKVIRPANVDPNLFSDEGVGTKVYKIRGVEIRITNLIGLSVYKFENSLNPFLILDEIVKENTSPIHIVDFHAEATGEKHALAWDFADKVSAIVGTHTHVPTADERLIKNRMAYITDIGMTGPYEGVIGAKREIIINKQRNNTRFILEVQKEGPYQLNAVLIEFNESTGDALAIKRINVVQTK